MKAIITADIHARPSNLENVLLVLREIIKYSEKHKIIHIWMLGDIFDDRVALNSRMLYYFIKAIETLTQSGTILHLIPGNHDWVIPQQGVHTLEVLRKSTVAGSAVMIHDEPQIYTLSKGLVYVIPYCVSSVEFKTELEKLFLLESQNGHMKQRGRYSRILFCHQGIDGFQVGSDIVLKQDLKAKSLKPHMFQHIICGHYHKYQQKGNIVYCGSPLQHNFGEGTNENGFLVLDEGDLYDEENPPTLDFIPLDVAPKYVTVTQDSARLKGLVDGNYVRVYDEILFDKISKMNPKKIVLVPQESAESEKRIDVDVSDTIHKAMGLYVEEKSDEEDWGGLKSLGEDILDTVKDD